MAKDKPNQLSSADLAELEKAGFDWSMLLVIAKNFPQIMALIKQLFDILKDASSEPSVEVTAPRPGVSDVEANLRAAIDAAKNVKK